MSATAASPCRALLSMRASTASCKIRFSLRNITSGAPISLSLSRRLFLLITRLYRSLTSEVACLPPSSATIGRIPGGVTGNTVRNIHSGLSSAFFMARTRDNLDSCFSLSVLLLLAMISLISDSNTAKSILLNTLYIASAPIPASKHAP